TAKFNRMVSYRRLGVVRTTRAPRLAASAKPPHSAASSAAPRGRANITYLTEVGQWEGIVVCGGKGRIGVGVGTLRLPGVGLAFSMIGFDYPLGCTPSPGPSGKTSLPFATVTPTYGS